MQRSIRYTTAALLSMLLVGASGCYSDRTPVVVYEDGVPDVGEVVRTGIEPGATMEVVPGEGIGVFIEVDEANDWHVYTSCDTKLSDQPCEFRVIATALQGDVSMVEGERLEDQDDDVVSHDDRHVLLDCLTYEGTDGMLFRTEPGAPVRFKVYLDGRLDPRFIYWVGDGALHQGAPGDPIVLIPGRGNTNE